MVAVRRLRSIWLVVAFGLLFTSLAPEALASWQCEGRTCGTTLWFCCCKSPEAAQDSNCATVQAPSEEGATAGCPANCNCTLTIRNAEAGRLPTATVAVHVFPVSWVGVAPPLSVALPKAVCLRQVESRGPPPASVALATPALRGPPALTSNSSGSTLLSRAAASA